MSNTHKWMVLPSPEPDVSPAGERARGPDGTADDELRARLLASERLEALRTSKLLSDDELYRLEDLIADSFEEETRASGVGVREQLTSMITLSERIASDSALARQIRRKFM